MKTFFSFMFGLAISGVFGGSGVLRAQQSAGDTIHTPGVGNPERTAILAVLHSEYTTGSGSKVKFKVNYLKVHDGWAWIDVVPLNPAGQPEGDEWPSLLRLQNGAWSSIDLIAVSQGLNEADGPQSPTSRFLQALRKKYPSVPADIVPVGR